MDRIPTPPPFPVGTKLRYIGTRHVWTVNNAGAEITIVKPGLEVVVATVQLGHRGTMRQLRDEDGPLFDGDGGDPYLDRTTDGYSTYEFTVDGYVRGQIIWPRDAGEWRIV